MHFMGFMDYQRSIKLVPHSGQLFSSRGSITYGVAKVLSKILKPLTGKSPHHIQITSDFLNKAKKITLQQGECLTSYDVTALFISVPIEPALKVIRDLLEKDDR